MPDDRKSHTVQAIFVFYSDCSHEKPSAQQRSHRKNRPKKPLHAAHDGENQHRQIQQGLNNTNIAWNLAWNTFTVVYAFQLDGHTNLSHLCSINFSTLNHFYYNITLKRLQPVLNDPQSRSSDERACCAKHPRLHDHLIPSRLYDLLMQDSVFVWRNPLQPLESTGKGCSIVHADFFHNVLHAHIGQQHLLGIFYPDIHQIF